MDGSQLRIPIEDIEYWAESTISHTLTKIVVVHYAYSAICVRETFDAIDAEVNGKAVQP